VSRKGGDEGPGVDRSGHLSLICYAARAMTIFVLLILVAAGAVLAWRKHRRSARAVFLLGAILFFAVGCGLVPAVALEDLQTGYVAEPVQPWQPRTAIVVLGAGTERVADTRAVEVLALAYGRVVKALELYLQCRHAGKVCRVIVSGGDPRGFGASEAKVYGAVLVRIGVDPTDLVLEGRSLNTWQNARFSAAWLNDHPQDEVLLVTSGLHLRRSILYFSHFGIRALPVRADYVAAVVSPFPQAYNFLLMDLALHEYTGLLRYRVYELLGWNIKAQHPGAVQVGAREPARLCKPGR
jgi:uncharacterized SAM-binding protein YcdF (DUF218 family)